MEGIDEGGLDSSRKKIRHFRLSVKSLRDQLLSQKKNFYLSGT